MTGVLPSGWFADVLLGRPPREAREAAFALVDEGMPPRTIYLDVLAPALQEVGARWQQGHATVAQEHLATALVSSIMATLAPTLGEPDPTGRTVVLACTDGEMHAVGLRMAGDFPEADGWTTVFLGAVTPGPDLERFARESVPDAVCLSTTLTTHLEHAANVIAVLRTLPRAPFILVGGRAYGDDPEVALAGGADGYGRDAAEASARLRTRFGME